MTNWCTKCYGSGDSGNPLANAFFGIFGMKPEVCEHCKGFQIESPPANRQIPPDSPPPPPKSPVVIRVIHEYEGPSDRD